MNWLKYRAKGAFKILTTLIVLSACSSTKTSAPVSDLTQPPSFKIKSHTVARGETLFAIAWRFNLDVDDLAAANAISAPYTIYPGQKLSLDLNKKTVSQVSTARTKQPVSTRSKIQTRKQQTKSPKSSETQTLRWVWPVSGKLITRFSGSDELRKGIDIAAKKGEPVLAAGDGEIVYAGAGLRGYGNLLIVKHNDRYLSAYAHNSKLIAREGKKVKAGEKIAEIGSSGTDRDKLHFEIRRDGKPVNPLGYLPKR